jgi:hypothetical protein
MKRALLMAVCSVFLSLALTPSARAYPLGGKVGLFGNVGYSLYDMKEFNQEVDFTNSLGILGSNLNPITGGTSLGGGLEYGIAEFLLLGADVNFLNIGGGKSEGSFFNSLAFTISTPAMEVGPFIRLVLPISDLFNLSVAGEADWFRAMEQVQNQLVSRTFTGSTVGVKVMAGGEIFAAPWMSVGIDVGYRFAKVTELKDGDTVLKNETGQNSELDYSGVFYQGGLRFYF